MKRILLSVIVLTITTLFINAQSFSLEWNDEVLDSTITIQPDTSIATEIVFRAIVNNNTNNGVNIKVVKNEILLLEGAESYFCWDSCYLSSVDTSAISIYIPAGNSSTDDAFAGHFEINETNGVSIVEYTFYNMDFPDENVKIVVNYDASPAAIAENILNRMRVSEIYPNPAENFVSINYDMPVEVELANVKIVNILGSVVKEQQIRTGNNKMTLDISDLNGGIYFYSIFVNGEIFSTKKLLVK